MTNAVANDAGLIVFVVARESIEALLVVGILWAWINRNPQAAKGKHYVIGGIIGGLLLAAVLAVAIRYANSEFGQQGQELFKSILLIVAAGTIVQMVVWMKEHGRTLKMEMENTMEESVRTSHWWGIFTLTMIAVGREGSETVTFLSAQIAEINSVASFGTFMWYFAIGLVIALFFFYLLQVGNRFISWRIFFRVTEILLLFLGCSMFMQAIGEGFYNQLIPAYAAAHFPNFDWTAYGVFGNPLYSDWLSGVLTHYLPVKGTLGGFLATVLCYRSNPQLIDLSTFATFWIIVWIVFSWRKRVLRRRSAEALNTVKA